MARVERTSRPRGSITITGGFGEPVFINGKPFTIDELERLDKDIGIYVPFRRGGFITSTYREDRPEPLGDTK